jgi:hypothetical protein
MIYLKTCKNYRIVGQTNNRHDATRMARDYVDVAGDGYDCIMIENGRIVGDSVSGYRGPLPSESIQDGTQGGSALTGREF